jgi:hypothetical protein
MCPRQTLSHHQEVASSHLGSSARRTTVLTAMSWLLIGTMLACAGSRHWFYRLMIAAVLSSMVYAIVDLEYPRLGAFNPLKDADSLLVNLRKSIR